MSIEHCIGHRKTQPKSGQRPSVGLAPELSKSIEGELRRRHVLIPLCSKSCDWRFKFCLDLPTTIDWSCELNKPPLGKSCFCQGVSS